MKSLFVKLAALTLCVSCLSSCFVRSNINSMGFGNPTGVFTENTLEWNNITAIDANSADIEYYQTDSACRVEIIADEAFNGKYTVENRNGKFKLHINNTHFSLKEYKFLVKVYSPYITDIAYSGSGDVTFINGLTSTRPLDLALTGSGDIRLGDLNVSSFEAGLVGSGDIKFDSLKCGEISFALAGSGDAIFNNVDATDISMAIAGSGDIKITGKANNVKAEIAGSGTIDMRDLSADSVNKSQKGSGKVLQ